MKSDIEIARTTELKKIKQVAEEIGIPRDEVENYGRYIAKIPDHLIDDEKVKKKQPHSGDSHHGYQGGYW
jgi:formate--tetrahydrofolate ligase